MLTATATALLLSLFAASPNGTQRQAPTLGATGVGVLTVSQQVIHLEPITVQELVGDARQPVVPPKRRLIL